MLVGTPADYHLRKLLEDGFPKGIWGVPNFQTHLRFLSPLTVPVWNGRTHSPYEMEKPHKPVFYGMVGHGFLPINQGG